MGIERSRILALFASVACVTACSAPSAGPGTALGRQAVIDSVNQALDVGDCEGAVSRILPLLNSSSSDNEVRMIAASAYSCHAGLQFFSYLDSLTQEVDSLAGAPLWEFLARSFPSDASDPNDRKVEGAVLAMDALMASLKSGIPILPISYINYPSYNPGSVLVNDRTTDANAYLVFVSMAAMGAFQSRFGAPFANGKKSQDLPWTTAAAVDADGCAYASSIVNFVDSLGALAEISSTLRTSVSAIQAAFQLGFDDACERGCQNNNPGGGWVPTGCTAATVCSACPVRLRDRTACTGLASDEVSCAAAGLVNFVNAKGTGAILGWQDGP
jgi:hypothetical protein